MLRSRSTGYTRLGSGRQTTARAANDGILNSTIPVYLVGLLFLGILALPSSQNLKAVAAGTRLAAARVSGGGER